MTTISYCEFCLFQSNDHQELIDHEKMHNECNHKNLKINFTDNIARGIRYKCPNCGAIRNLDDKRIEKEYNKLYLEEDS